MTYRILGLTFSSSELEYILRTFHICWRLIWLPSTHTQTHTLHLSPSGSAFEICVQGNGPVGPKPSPKQATVILLFDVPLKLKSMCLKFPHLLINEWPIWRRMGNQKGIRYASHSALVSKISKACSIQWSRVCVVVFMCAQCDCVRLCNSII